MADLDADRARAASVAVPPASKEGYLKASEDQRTGFVKTADAADPGVGWTAARGALQDPQQMPGQMFAPSQLPDPEVARATGFPPVQIPADQILDSDDVLHPQGPEPSEVAHMEHREALRARYVELDVESKEQAAQAHDDDAAPEQGTSGVPAGGRPGEANQEGATSDSGRTQDEGVSAGGGDGGSSSGSRRSSRGGGKNS